MLNNFLEENAFDNVCKMAAMASIYVNLISCGFRLAVAASWIMVWLSQTPTQWTAYHVDVGYLRKLMCSWRSQQYQVRYFMWIGWNRLL